MLNIYIFVLIEAWRASSVEREDSLISLANRVRWRSFHGSPDTLYDVASTGSHLCANIVMTLTYNTI